MVMCCYEDGCHHQVQVIVYIVQHGIVVTCHTSPNLILNIQGSQIENEDILKMDIKIRLVRHKLLRGQHYIFPINTPTPPLSIITNS